MMNAATPSAYVDLADVGVTYRSPRGPVVALDGVTLQIREAEFLSVLGPSGCGKSTLLKCVAGLEACTTGHINVLGKPTDATGADGLIARQQFVELGETRGDQVAILKGVNPGDEIVTAGQLKLHNGSAVKVNNTVQPASNPAPDLPNT